MSKRIGHVLEKRGSMTIWDRADEPPGCCRAEKNPDKSWDDGCLSTWIAILERESGATAAISLVTRCNSDTDNLRLSSTQRLDVMIIFTSSG